MTVRAALTFSFVLLLAAGSWGQYVELDRKLDGVEEPSRVLAAVKASSIGSDHEVLETLKNEGLDDEDKADHLREIVDLRSRIEAPSSTPTNLKAEVGSIKSSPLYRDPGIQETSNWLSRALARLRNINWRPNTPEVNAPSFSFLGPWLYYLMWGLIGAAVCLLIYLAAKHISWRMRLERRATALLEDSEPERSLDEWLLQADLLESEGRYREAVRALYLACLLRFDEALVARFDRSQTNWEHLERIEASPKKPAQIDFRTPTQLFDRVWYGRIVRGREDVQAFRAWYIEITDSLKRRAA